MALSQRSCSSHSHFSHLDRFPPVHEDEPYIAASAARLASGGPHGNPLFTGFHSAERHVFLYPPLLPVLQSLVFRATDIDVVSMRIPSVVAGLATTILAGALAARTGGAAGGALAAALLVILAAAGGVNRTSGIPLLDSARIARYDILVPAFGLASLVALERAYEKRSRSGTDRCPGSMGTGPPMRCVQASCSQASVSRSVSRAGSVAICASGTARRSPSDRSFSRMS